MHNVADPIRLRQSVLRLLETDPPEDEKLLAEIESRSQPGQPLYSSILYVLTHLNFTEAQARRNWSRVLAHRARMRKSLGRDAGLRVALLDYFVNVSQELKNPKVIEISIYERTERSALTDGLTGLFNRAYFNQSLQREIHRTRRHGSKLSLVMLDLDNFKQLNDTRGHVAGDRALVKVAGIVGECLRDIDISARYGGEEFALILPETPVDGAFVVAERIRKRVETQLGSRKGSRGVTVSGGIATYPDDALEAEHLVMQADSLLYRAKANGKNRIVIADPNRRRHERIPMTCPVELEVGARKTIAAMTRNVSEGGLLLDAPVPLPVGRRVGVVVRPREDRVLSLRGLVVRAATATQGEGRYELGMRLLSDPRRNRELVLLNRVGHA